MVFQVPKSLNFIRLYSKGISNNNAHRGKISTATRSKFAFMKLDGITSKLVPFFTFPQDPRSSSQMKFDETSTTSVTHFPAITGRMWTETFASNYCPGASNSGRSVKIGNVYFPWPVVIYETAERNGFVMSRRVISIWRVDRTIQRARKNGNEYGYVVSSANSAYNATTRSSGSANFSHDDSLLREDPSPRWPVCPQCIEHRVVVVSRCRDAKKEFIKRHFVSRFARNYQHNARLASYNGLNLLHIIISGNGALINKADATVKLVTGNGSAPRVLRIVREVVFVSCLSSARSLLQQTRTCKIVCVYTCRERCLHIALRAARTSSSRRYSHYILLTRVSSRCVHVP